ncbi:claudin-19-like isoform X1 [Chelonia mydas]|uniref:claudin-19-like isoform X1 n=1 Tax=Chelonia mydas TaxID=8469 RepID=UPI00042BC45B|nr:claudin-19-like isoform X1 [Chelonia mydas]XP_043378233.1 claudin-19-like isoform X1 [Chelonia mydas]
MASSSLQISALLLALAGLIILLVTTVSNRWKISSTATAVITANWIYEGLWMNCAATALGSVQCKKFSSLLSLDTYIQACRALMIISIVLGLLATVLSLFGLKCTQVGMSNENTKVKISVTGGVIFILAGLSSMVAVSWYAARITAQFFDPLYGGTKYELGDALYLGWAGSILSMLGGIFLTCSCKRGKRGKHSDRKYDYSAGQAAHQPCIYTKNSDTVMTSKDYV